jgi:SAM-dependent methyltransferase
MDSFDDLAIAYDNSIDWDARLARELPFLLKSLPQVGSARILDIACGSGRHSIAFAKNSHAVTGFDNSQSMIDAAGKLAKKRGVSVDFFKADMLDFTRKVDARFNLAICLGNSLALLPSLKDVAQVIDNVHGILDTDGTFIFQVLNFQEILKTGFRFFSMKTGRIATDQEVVFSRFFDHSISDDRSLLVLTSYIKNTDDWESHVRQQVVLHLNHDWLTNILNDVGFSQVELCGDYSESPFAPASHRSLIIKARK